MVATQSQLILLKSQEIARDIIAKAVELHRLGLGVTDSYESDVDIGLSATESQFLFETSHLVQEVIERALELNQADGLAKQDTVDDSEAVMAVFEAVDPMKGLSPVESHIFFRAKEMVHDSVARAIVINTGIKAMNACLNTQSTATATTDSEFRRNQSDLVMDRVEDIVYKVIRKAIKMNLEAMEEKSLHPEEVKRDGKGRMPPSLSDTSPVPPKGNLKKGVGRALSDPTAKAHKVDDVYESDSEESYEDDMEASAKKRRSISEPTRKELFIKTMDGHESEQSDEEDYDDDDEDERRRKAKKRTLASRAKGIIKPLFLKKTKVKSPHQVTIMRHNVGEGSVEPGTAESLHEIPPCDAGGGSSYERGMRLYKESRRDSQRKLQQRSAELACRGVLREGDAAVMKSATSSPGDLRSTCDGTAKSEVGMSTRYDIKDGNLKSTHGSILKESVMPALDKEGSAESAAGGAESAAGNLKQKEQVGASSFLEETETTQDAISDSTWRLIEQAGAVSAVKSAESQASDLKMLGSGSLLASTETELSVRLMEAKISHHGSSQEKISGPEQRLKDRFELLIERAKTPSPPPSVTSMKGIEGRVSVTSLPVKGKYGQVSKLNVERISGDRGKFFGIIPAKFRNDAFYQHTSVGDREGSSYSRDLSKMEGSTYSRNLSKMEWSAFSRDLSKMEGSSYSRDLSKMLLDSRPNRPPLKIRSDPSYLSSRTYSLMKTGCGCCSGTSRSPSPLTDEESSYSTMSQPPDNPNK